eukprot:scaffold17343_cov66-Phaeocystis_antarctica.AAC.5
MCRNSARGQPTPHDATSTNLSNWANIPLWLATDVLHIKPLGVRNEWCPRNLLQTTPISVRTDTPAIVESDQRAG